MHQPHSNTQPPLSQVALRETQPRSDERFRPSQVFSRLLGAWRYCIMTPSNPLTLLWLVSSRRRCCRRTAASWVSRATINSLTARPGDFDSSLLDERCRGGPQFSFGSRDNSLAFCFRIVLDVVSYNNTIHTLDKRGQKRAQGYRTGARATTAALPPENLPVRVIYKM